MTQRLGALVVAPLLVDYLNGDAARGRELDRAVANRMADGYLTEITIWRADGHVVYSNDLSTIGTIVSPPPVEVGAAINGVVTSAFEDEPEVDASTIDGQAEGYVEVYVPMRLAGHEPMAFEAYYDYRRVDAIANGLLRQLLPLVIAPLLILQLIQIPISWSLARRLTRHENERAQLLEQALTVSDRERIRFAGDLHDGPIQDLAGIKYALEAVAPTVPEQNTALMDRVQGALQRSVKSLRGLMTDLYPPDLRTGNLEDTLATLAERLRSEGVEVQIQVDALPELSEESLATLYRLAREALVNVDKHARANLVTVTVGQVAGTRHRKGQPMVQLVVADDGRGIDQQRLDRREEGHLGLRLLHDRIRHLGGDLVIESAPARGTRLVGTVPVTSTPTGGAEPSP